MARPRKNLPANGLQVIRDLASNGVQETIIAKALGMDLKTWRRIRTEDPEAKAVWEEARALEEDKLAGELFRQAIEEKNTVACIFLLKARHKYRDVGATDGDGEGRVNININLPASLPKDAYQKLIEIAPRGAESSEAA